MTRKYYTLCIWNTDNAAWYDNFGSYDKGEVLGEYEDARTHYKAKHLAIITTGELAVDMITARDALSHPKG